MVARRSLRRRLAVVGLQRGRFVFGRPGPFGTASPRFSGRGSFGVEGRFFAERPFLVGGCSLDEGRLVVGDGDGFMVGEDLVGELFLVGRALRVGGFPLGRCFSWVDVVGKGGAPPGAEAPSSSARSESKSELALRRRHASAPRRSTSRIAAQRCRHGFVPSDAGVHVHEAKSSPKPSAEALNRTSCVRWPRTTASTSSSVTRARTTASRAK